MGPTRASAVHLREIDAETEPAVLALSVRDHQTRFVADNARSLEQARADEGAWYRAIYADDTPVGLVLVHDENLRNNPEQPDYYYLWRLMIDQRYQGLGLARRAMQLVIAHIRSRPNARQLFLHCIPGPGSAEGFYHKLGFLRTGVEEHGEQEMRLDLDAPGS